MVVNTHYTIVSVFYSLFTCYLYYILYVTGEMDPSGGSVPAGLNPTGGMEPGININI